MEDGCLNLRDLLAKLTRSQLDTELHPESTAAPLACDHARGEGRGVRSSVGVRTVLASAFASMVLMRFCHTHRLPGDRTGRTASGRNAIRCSEQLDTADTPDPAELC